ncbi:glycoside hydrolase family 15 protein [Methanohalophilus halophilus]|uniref:Glucan 1,4-alpha-glucosidase n=1 Tax=Methanohalophilus halophilus TaxID=2177 RepID=A0A1L3Q4P7_9EURY|nr:glycoside hydrolase family 15 protein [Methanohalophilus halophilus]APH39731.1 glucan 1,4-alpha-glucosidase [Methanohalophilus halophilus]RNI08929.1 glucan 1,4-alpha-glucosidase [Methanohalophilus halophilus]SDW37975.1 oligosaccharide amylase [Methanohalophilus halophilus]
MIRQPNVMVGNEKLLVTMGKKGELVTFFYPARDWAQHLVDSQACIYAEGKLIWSNNHEWAVKQEYLEEANIVNTELKHPTDIRMSILDFVHPSLPVLIRKYEICSHKKFHGKFFYYSNLRVGDTHEKNSAFCDEKANLLVQYRHSCHLGITSVPRFTQWQVGKSSDRVWWTNAKYDMEDGQLQNNPEDIGKLNNAIGWNLDLEPGEKKTITVFLGAASGRNTLYKRMRFISSIPIEKMLDKTKEHWLKWLSRKKAVQLPELENQPNFRKSLYDMYDRALLCLNLLSDDANGSFVAAPEFDHDFEMCGGYGFCWNRDSAEVVTALLDASYPDYCARFFKWCKRTQLTDGSWFQRYWLDGKEAPSWGNFKSSTQIDETGSTLFAIEKYYHILEGVEKLEFLDDMWVTVLSGAEYLMKRTPSGLHEPCRGLWETYKGIFSYTNASIYGGLKGAAIMAKDYGEPELAERWDERAALIKKTTIEKMWLNDGYFGRGIIDDALDATMDASIIGAFVPFGMLSTEDQKEREMIISMIYKVAEKLKVPVNGYFGIKRFEDDNYIGGNPWVVTTLWLSRAMLTLAVSGHVKAEERTRLMDSGLEYIKWSIRGTTCTGLLPEQVDKHTGKPAWAIPLSWSCALMITNILLLNESINDETTNVG